MRFDRFQQKLKHRPLVTRLPAAPAFLAALAARLFRLDNVARRWFGRGGGVLASCGQLLFELRVFVTHPRVLLLQLVDARKRRSRLRLQVGNLSIFASNMFCPSLAVRRFARFSQFHGAGRYRDPWQRARSIIARPLDDHPAFSPRGPPHGELQAASLWPILGQELDNANSFNQNINHAV